MIPTGLLDQRATVHHLTMTRDPKGFPVQAETGTDVYPCRLDLGSTVEDTVRRDTIVSLKRLILPAAAVVDADDEVTIDGRRYKVVGEPDRLRAFGREHHVEVSLRSAAEV